MEAGWTHSSFLQFLGLARIVLQNSEWVGGKAGEISGSPRETQQEPEKWRLGGGSPATLGNTARFPDVEPLESPLMKSCLQALPSCVRASWEVLPRGVRQTQNSGAA